MVDAQKIRTRPRFVMASAWLAALLSGTGAVSAETLRDAFEVALSNDWPLKAAQSRVDAASAEHDAAQSGRFPDVSLAVGVTRWRDVPAFDFTAAGLPGELPLFGGDSMRTSNARISVPLYSGGGIGASIDAASAAITVRQRAQGTTAQNLKLAVAERYIGVLRAASAFAVADATRVSLAAHTRDVDDMFRNGQVPKNDLLAASVSLADAEQRFVQAENALALANAAYNRRLGRPLDEPVKLDPTLPPTEAQLRSAPVEDLTVLAWNHRDELAELEATRASLLAGSSAARAESRPQLAIAGGYSMLENDFLNREDFWSVGIEVRWNVFNAGRTRSRARALTSEALAVERERNELRSLIELAVREAWLNLRESQQRISVASGAIEQAEENLRVVRDRYLQGEGTNTEVLDAETLVATSRANFENARHDAKLAEFRLARATGTL